MSLNVGLTLVKRDTHEPDIAKQKIGEERFVIVDHLLYGPLRPIWLLEYDPTIPGSEHYNAILRGQANSGNSLKRSKMPLVVVAN